MSYIKGMFLTTFGFEKGKKRNSKLVHFLHATIEILINTLHFFIITVYCLSCLTGVSCWINSNLFILVRLRVGITELW